MKRIADRDTRVEQAAATNYLRRLQNRPLAEAKVGELAGNVEMARRYLQTLERGETGAALSGFFAPGVILEEFPNLLTPLGKRRDLAAALEGCGTGQKVYVPADV